MFVADDNHPRIGLQFHDRKRDRVIPIDAGLLPLLRQRWAGRQEREQLVYRTGRLNGWHKELIKRPIVAAKVDRWPDLFQSSGGPMTWKSRFKSVTLPLMRSSAI